MPPSLLDSQFKDLQPLQADEDGITLSITAPPAQLVAQILASEGRSASRAEGLG